MSLIFVFVFGFVFNVTITRNILMSFFLAPIPVALIANATVLIGDRFTLFNFIVIAGTCLVLIPEFKNRFHVECKVKDFSIGAMGGVIAIGLYFLSIYNANLFHYDYFHSIYLAKDLAISGDVRSEWMATVDSDSWFVVQQATGIVLDSLEYLLEQKITGLLPRVYIASLLILNYIVLRNRVNYVVALTFVALVLPVFYEVIVYYRPHFMVGLLLSLIPLIFFDKVNDTKSVYLLFVFILFSTILAKREGLILVPFVCFLMCYRHQNLTGLKAVSLSLFFIMACLLLGLVPKIGGIPVAQVFYQSILSVDFGEAVLPSKSLILSCSWIFAAFFLCAICVCLRRYSTAAFLIGLVVFIIASAIILFGQGRWNEGTIVRKIQYILSPVLVATYVLVANNLQTPKINLRQYLLATCSIFFLGLVGYSSYIWYWHALQPNKEWSDLSKRAMALYDGLNATEIKHFCFAKSSDDAFLKSPYGDIQTSIFPILNGLTEKEISFKKSFSVRDRCDIVVLPNAIDIESHLFFLRDGNYKFRKLDQSYSILLDSNLEKHFPVKILQKRSDGSVVDGVQYKNTLSETNYTTDPPDVRIAVIPWGDGNQVLVAQGPESGSKSFDLYVNNIEGYYYDKFVFGSHPYGDAMPKAIYIITNNGPIKHSINYSVGKVEEIPLGTSSEFHIIFDFPDDYSQVFKSSYFDIMNPTFILEKSKF